MNAIRVSRLLRLVALTMLRRNCGADDIFTKLEENLRQVAGLATENNLDYIRERLGFTEPALPEAKQDNALTTESCSPVGRIKSRQTYRQTIEG